MTDSPENPWLNEIDYSTELDINKNQVRTEAILAVAYELNQIRGILETMLNTPSVFPFTEIITRQGE